MERAMKPKTVGRWDGGLATKPPVDAGGLSAESIILTLDGEKSVTDLRPGDRIVTRDTGKAVVRQIKAAWHRVHVVRIQAGSLGHTRPDRDVILPAGQMILVRDWRAQAIFGARETLVPVSRLVDGEFVTLRDRQDILLFSLVFDAAHILYVDGLELASAVTTAPRSVRA